MSAAPLPKPDPEPAPEPTSQADAEGWALLEALRRRLDDQGAQGRKTQHQVTQLAESIGALVAEQRRRAKWANLNSFVAYLIFTLLVGAGFYMLYRSRANELVEARDSAQRERDQAVGRAKDLDAKATARDAADGRAWEVYQLLEAGKRSEAAGKLGSLADLPLSRTERAVLAARAHETQVMEVDAALKAAAASFKAGRYGEVIAPLEAALVSEPAGARASTMRYFLGVAYAKTNQLDKATQLLSAAVAADVEQEDARFQLASALDRSGQYAKARTEYDRFATAHPQSQLAVFAMRRSATLARMPAAAAPAVKAAAPATNAAATNAPATTTNAPASKSPAPATAPGPVATTPAPATKPQVPTTNPAPAKTAPKWGPAKPAAPKPAPTTTAPVEPPAVEPPAPEVEPMSGGASIERAPKSSGSTSITEPAPTSEPAPAQLPSFEIDRTPAPSPLGPPIEREPAPSVPSVPRGEQAPPPARFASEDRAPTQLSADPKPSPAKPAPPVQEQPVKPAPAPPVQEQPTKPAPDPAPKFPSVPRNESLPSFPIDRTPAPSPLGPPVEKPPAPAPNAPPRGETPPPPTRF